MVTDLLYVALVANIKGFSDTITCVMAFHTFEPSLRADDSPDRRFYVARRSEHWERAAATLIFSDRVVAEMPHVMRGSDRSRPSV